MHLSEPGAQKVLVFDFGSHAGLSEAAMSLLSVKRVAVGCEEVAQLLFFLFVL